MIHLVSCPICDGFFKATFIKEERVNPEDLFPKRETVILIGKMIEREVGSPEIIFDKKSDFRVVGKEFAKNEILDYLGW